MPFLTFKGRRLSYFILILFFFYFLDITDKIECNDKPRCIVPGCKYPCLTTRFTHPLPTSKEILKKWLQKLNRPEVEPSFTSVICYRHFQDHDYVFSYVATENRQSRCEIYLFFSFRSFTTSEKYISFAQLVYFLREVCLLFNFWMMKFTITLIPWFLRISVVQF